MDEPVWLTRVGEEVEAMLPAPCPFRALTGPLVGLVRDLFNYMSDSQAIFVEVAPPTCRRHAYHLALWRTANCWCYGATTKHQLDYWLVHGCLVVAPGYSAGADRFVLLPGATPWQ